VVVLVPAIVIAVGISSAFWLGAAEVIARDGGRRVVAMRAWRDVFPLSWVAEQTDDPVRPHIAFRHVRGWTRGMDVEWLFEPTTGGTRVTIEHRLRFLFPFASDWL